MLKREHVKDMLAKRAATPTAGNNWLKRMRQLMAFAVESACAPTIRRQA